MSERLCGELTRNQADTYGLVLSASGLPHVVVKTAQGWEIWVNGSIHAEARLLIAQYIDENRPPIEAGDPSDKDRIHYHTKSAAWVALLLFACHLATRLPAESEIIVRRYSASAYDILNGEIYRCSTALMLHADFLHLLGNVAGMVIFGTAVCNLAGPGVGWLMVLLSGVIGNLANALLLQRGHLSIGASTAVFGAIGILCAYQFCTKIKSADRRIKAWLPLAGGLALLGLLGGSAHADLTAHLFGFAAGIGLGLCYTLYLQRFLKRKHQLYGAAAATGIVLLSWLGPLDLF